MHKKPQQASSPAAFYLKMNWQYYVHLSVTGPVAWALHGRNVRRKRPSRSETNAMMVTTLTTTSKRNVPSRKIHSAKKLAISCSSPSTTADIVDGVSKMCQHHQHRECKKAKLKLKWKKVLLRIYDRLPHREVVAEVSRSGSNDAAKSGSVMETKAIGKAKAHE